MNDAFPFAGVDSLDESASSSNTSQKDSGNQTNTNADVATPTLIRLDFHQENVKLLL